MKPWQYCFAGLFPNEMNVYAAITWMVVWEVRTSFVVLEFLTSSAVCCVQVSLVFFLAFFPFFTSKSGSLHVVLTHTHWNARQFSLDVHLCGGVAM